MIHQLCCQKPLSQSERVSGTDRWRLRDLGNTALAVTARQQEPSPQGCIVSLPGTFPLAQTQPAGKLRRGGKGGQLVPGRHGQSWVLLAVGPITGD